MGERYCTVKDIADAVRIDLVLQWARDDARETDALAYARLDQAIARASDEINLYVAKAAALPLKSVPAALTDCCVKMAVYKTASRRGIVRDSADQTLRQNYEDALSVLRMIASGKIGLGINGDNEPVRVEQDRIAASFPRSRMMPGDGQ